MLIVSFFAISKIFSIMEKAIPSYGIEKEERETKCIIHH